MKTSREPPNALVKARYKTFHDKATATGAGEYVQSFRAPAKQTVTDRLAKGDTVTTPTGQTAKVMISDNVAGKYLVRVDGDTSNLLFSRKQLNAVRVRKVQKNRRMPD